MNNFIIIDLPALLALVFCALSCALLGSFLVIRRESLLADAISHSVLPGIVLAFYFIGHRQGIWIFVGALLAALSAVISIRFLREYGKMDNSTITGVVFSIYFALGVVLLERFSASNVDLDVDCVLHGQIETIFWSIPSLNSFWSFESLKLMPIEVFQSLFGFILVLLFIIFFFKELVLFSFDPEFSKVNGYRVLLLDIAFNILLAIVVVSSFKVVGSILVIALFVCPPAAARMFADRVLDQILWSCLFSLIACFVGYYIATYFPLQLGYEHSIGVSGVVAAMTGVVLSCAVIFAPKYGMFGRKVRIELQKFAILKDDILAYLYRESEKDNEVQILIDRIVFDNKFYKRRYFFYAYRSLINNGLIKIQSNKIGLTKLGLEESKNVIRKHRLWEAYMVQQIGIKDDHVHDTAEELEHIISQKQEEYLEKKILDNSVDPHGKPIPN